VTGTLEAGKRADITIIDLQKPHLQPVHNIVSQLVYAARADDVRTTIVDGEIVFHEGRFTAVDEAEVVAKAQERARKLMDGGPGRSARLFATRCLQAYPPG